MSDSQALWDAYKNPSQLPHQGTLKLTYTPGKPLSSKLSLETIGDCLNGPREDSSKTFLHAQEEEARTVPGRLTDSFKKGRSEDNRDGHHLPDDNGRTSACGQGFHSLVYLLKSLASPVQVCCGLWFQTLFFINPTQLTFTMIGRLPDQAADRP